MSIYYNEIDAAACHVLDEMSARDVIAPGIADPRSIKDVTADDIRHHTQCHWFAGGGFWSVAARLAGWPDIARLWTASCPCQGLSAAGKGPGADDPRHLWPDLYRIICEAGDDRPPVIVGEQVSGKAGYDWFDGVRADLESQGYACEAIDIPACAVDAPHQRNRLYWYAVVNSEGQRRGEGRSKSEFRGGWPTPAGANAPGHVGDRIREGLEGHGGHGNGGEGWQAQSHRSVTETDDCCGVSHVENPGGIGGWQSGAGRHDSDRDHAERTEGSDWAGEPDEGHGTLGNTHRPRQREPQGNYAERGRRAAHTDEGSHWSDADWIECHDGKARRAKPGVRNVDHGFPGGIHPSGNPGDANLQEAEKVEYSLLVSGMVGRVDLWRIAGNAIVPWVAAEVIRAYMEVYREDLI